MSKTPLLFLETLESRIAPASVILSQGANLLNTGDNAFLSSGEGSVPIVKVTGGKALVFWDSDQKDITGISVSNNAKIEVLGNVNGDIVTNLTDAGFLSDSDGNVTNGLDGGRLLGSTIAGIKISSYNDEFGRAQNGNVARIIAGGSINNVSISGQLDGVYAGDGIFDAVATDAAVALTDSVGATSFTYDVRLDIDGPGSQVATTMTFLRSNAVFGAAASVTSVTFATGDNIQIFAGDGLNGVTGTSANGGSISKISFIGAVVDTIAPVPANFFNDKSYTLSAGDGGSGAATGGIGGSINTLTESGSSGSVIIQAGKGGDGLTKGGIGGSLSFLDVQGVPLKYSILAGDGGKGLGPGTAVSGGAGGSITNSNIASLTTSQFISLSGDFTSNYTNTVVNQDYFIINRGSGEMVLIDGFTLTAGPVINPLAAGPVDAVLADLNSDTFLDVVVVYSSGSFGVLINDGTGNFAYSVADLGGPASRVITGDFLGNGDGFLELAFVGTTATTTTVKLFEVTNAGLLGGATPADAFASETNRVQNLVINKGNAADAVGGRFDVGNGGSLSLNGDGQDDFVIAFADGTVQGILASGTATTLDPFKFSLATTSVVAASTGVRDIDFNFATLSTDGRIAIVTGNGARLDVVTVGALDPLTGQAVLTVTPSSLALPPVVGSLLQTKWAQSALTTGNTTEVFLTAIASTGSTSQIMAYDGDLNLRSSYTASVALNSTANNFQTLHVANSNASMEADAFIFTTADVTNAAAFQSVLPAGLISPTGVVLPFGPKLVDVIAGNGGTATTGAGGAGGAIKSINLDSNGATVRAGDGGISTLGAGGDGGLIDNTASFTTASKVLIKPAISVTNNLYIYGGAGATAVGAATTAKGGNGGLVKGVQITDSDLLVINGGAGGGSRAAQAGNGGGLDTITILNSNNVYLYAGSAGAGTVGTKATGGNGGSITKLTAGDSVNIVQKAIRGNLFVNAGDGGNSAFAKAGNGGAITTLKAQNVYGDLYLYAGDGGNAAGTVTASVGGNGGAISALTLDNIGDSVADSLLVIAGNGGSGNTGNAGNGGLLGTFTLTRSGLIGVPAAVSTLTAGNGGNSVLGSGGNGGNIATIKSTYAGLISLYAGDGGNATGPLGKGKGGNGGTLTGITAQILGSGRLDFISGSGGNAIGGVGGNAGAISTISLKLNPDDGGVDANGLDNDAVDTGLVVKVLGGDGGNGTAGGTGAAIATFDASGVFDQSQGSLTVINPIAVRLEAGDGGTGTTLAGGKGGDVKLSKALSGISHIDDDSVEIDFDPTIHAGVVIVAGNGGAGAKTGGAGGAVGGIKSANVLNSAGQSISKNILSSAFIFAGNGGNVTNGTAGAGGAVGTLNLVVERLSDTASDTGNLLIQAGNGGTATTGTGGVGGAVTSSNLQSVKGNNVDGYGILVTGGNGGNGSLKGGVGGSVTTLTITLPQLGVGGTDLDIYGGVFIAGNGGNGTGLVKSVGGIGGSVTGITQTKDVNSAINLIQAGRGGNSSIDTIGGKGGDVGTIKTNGNIGASVANGTPLGVFNTVAVSALIDALASSPDLQQGAFAGLGGSGLADGANGKITSVSAQSIAALGAANLAGVFEDASAITTITTLLLGFDINGSTTFNAGDGFVRGDVFTGLKSLDKTLVSDAALSARTAAFVI